MLKFIGLPSVKSTVCYANENFNCRQTVDELQRICMTINDNACRQTDAGAYKGRTGSGLGGSFARSTAVAGSSLPSYRSSYASANSSRGSTKDRTTTGYTSSSLDKRDRDKIDDKPAYKYTCKLIDTALKKIDKKFTKIICKIIFK